MISNILTQILECLQFVNATRPLGGQSTKDARILKIFTQNLLIRVTDKRITTNTIAYTATAKKISQGTGTVFLACGPER